MKKRNKNHKENQDAASGAHAPAPAAISPPNVAGAAAQPAPPPAERPYESPEAFTELHTATVRPYTNGELVGTLPPNRSELKGRTAPLLLDKLGERLAFERTGTRLYEMLLAKLDLRGTWPGGPTRSDLEHIRDEEFRHFGLVTDAIRQLGGDPTAVTPAADVTGVLSEGLQKVLGDPRTTFAQALQAILVAELTDRDGWTLLVDLADKARLAALAASFRQALATEETHLEKVRNWHRAWVSTDAGEATAPGA